MNDNTQFNSSYIPISFLFNSEVCKKIDEQMEKVYVFAKNNMISIIEVPNYVSGAYNGKKYASNSLKSEIANLPAFIHKIANTKTNIIKTSQKNEGGLLDFTPMEGSSNTRNTTPSSGKTLKSEKTPKEELKDDSDQWQKSWWATGLSFLPGFGTVIPLVNLIRSSSNKCSSASAKLGWPGCWEAIFDVLTMVADIFTVIGLILSIPSMGGSLPLAYLATAAKTLRPIIKLIVTGGKAFKVTSWGPKIAYLLQAFPGMLWLVSKAFQEIFTLVKGRRVADFFNRLGIRMENWMSWLRTMASKTSEAAIWLDKWIISTGDVASAAKLESKIKSKLPPFEKVTIENGPTVLLTRLKSASDPKKSRAVTFITKDTVAYIEEGVVKLGKVNLEDQTFKAIGEPTMVMMRNNPVLQALSRANMPTDLSKSVKTLGITRNKNLKDLEETEMAEEVIKYINSKANLISTDNAKKNLESIAEIYGKVTGSANRGPNIVQNLNDFVKEIFGLTLADLKAGKATNIKIDNNHLIDWYAKTFKMNRPGIAQRNDFYYKHIHPNRSKIVSDYIKDVAKRVFLVPNYTIEGNDMTTMIEILKAGNPNKLHHLNYLFTKNGLLKAMENLHGGSLNPEQFNSIYARIIFKAPLTKMIAKNFINITGLRLASGAVQLAGLSMLYYWNKIKEEQQSTSRILGTAVTENQREQKEVIERGKTGNVIEEWINNLPKDIDEQTRDEMIRAINKAQQMVNKEASRQRQRGKK